MTREERDLRNTIALILDANYHTAISKAFSTADQILAALSPDERLIANAVSDVLGVLEDNELIEESPPHGHALLGERLFETILAALSQRQTNDR